MKNKNKPELEYELELTKKILERIIELNHDKQLKIPDEQELDVIEKQLKLSLEYRYPKYKIQKK